MKIITSLENLKTYKVYLAVEEAIHDFFKKKGYLKINLPVLSPALIPESYLEVFETERRYLDKKEKLYLTPSPELFLKRLLAHGIGDCYYLGKAFRNGERNSDLHSGEFEMLEFYKVGVSFLDLAAEVLELLLYIAFCLYKNDKTKIKDYRRRFRRWEWFTIAQAFHRFANIKENELFDKKKFLAKAKIKGYKTGKFSYEDIFSQIYTQEIEPKLGKGFPTLLYDYPKEFAALAKPNPDEKTAQRFEFYINGIELGDCYTELTDWKEQERRFQEEDEKRKQEKKINHKIDKGFIDALKYGLPDCAGIAIGVERLTMIFAGVDSIDKLKLLQIK